MSKKIILKKLEQLLKLLDELKAWLVEHPDFGADLPLLRASERNLELIMELATDINALILGKLKRPIPDTYRGSFEDLGKAGALGKALLAKLIGTVKLRNKLVHHYDFKEDFKKFYRSLNSQIPVLEKYSAAVLKFSEKFKK